MLRFIRRGARIGVLDVTAQDAIDENCELPRRGGDGLGLASAVGETAVEGTEGAVDRASNTLYLQQFANLQPVLSPRYVPLDPDRVKEQERRGEPARPARLAHPRRTAWMAARASAPDNRPIEEKLAASISPPPSAARHTTELAAKATIAAVVRRLTSLTRATASDVVTINPRAGILHANRHTTDGARPVATTHPVFSPDFCLVCEGSAP